MIDPHLTADQRRRVLVGVFMTEAARLNLGAFDLRMVASEISRLIEQPEALERFLGPTCGPHSVFAQQGGQWFCRTCERGFYGENAEAQAKAHR
jgi:hypothetical protein